ncbi:MAG: MMPL family transporter [Pseudomonadota bacterium]
MTAGFGIEKLGLVSLRHPWICLLIIAVITPFAIYGATHNRFSSDVREIFRSDDPAFVQLDLLNERFPASQPDLQIVAESKTPFDTKDLEALQSLHEGLLKIDGVTGVLSMFTAVDAPEEDTGEPQPIFPEDLSKLQGSDAARKKITDHPLIHGKLLSDDWRLAVFALTLEQLAQNTEGQAAERALVAEIGKTTQETLAGTNVSARLTGLAVIRDEILSGLSEDQAMFGLVAVGLGIIVCWIFLRSIPLIIIAVVPAVIAVAWLRGGMWLFGQDINLLTGIAPTIILVIVLSNCLHLLFSIRRGLERGDSLESAIESAVRRVGPACVLTSLTTALAMSSLIWMPHSFIADFGVTTASGTAMSLCITLLMVPALSVLLLKGFAKKVHGKVQKPDIFRRGIDGLCARAADAVAAYPRAIALLGLVLTVGGLWLHVLNEPQYSYANNMPPQSTALKAIQAYDNKLAGASTLEVLLYFPKDHALKSYKTIEIIRQVHKILDDEAAFGAVTSLHTVEEWLGGGDIGEDRLIDFLEAENTKDFAASFVALKENAIRISAQFHAMTSDEMTPLLDRVENQMRKVEAQNPGLKIAVTGIVPVSSAASHEMIKQLNISLITAIGLILVLIGVGMRSLRAGLASVLPNLFPIAMGGAYLHLVEGGLEFTSLVAFAVGFGIAVDATIHYLTRYRLERASLGSVADALKKTTMDVGPVVIMATVLIAGGIGTTMLSKLPTVALYGTIVVIVLTSAVIGALLFLPAVMSTMERYWPSRWKPEAKDQAKQAATEEPETKTA